tara:strand:+ start:15206 stop:16153 length:948 start_codon:yes stop_codon:yes gene_type:complete
LDSGNKEKLTKNDLDMTSFDNVLSDPFPCAVVDDFLPQRLFDPFLESLHSYSKHLSYKANKGRRMSVLYGTKSYSNLLRNKEFRDIHEYLISDELLKKIHFSFNPYYSAFGLREEFRDVLKLPFKINKTEVFVTDNIFKKALIKYLYNPWIRNTQLRKYIRRFFKTLRSPFLYPSISLSNSKGGYLEPVHADSRHKIFIGLIYLDDMDGEGEISVFKSNRENLSIYDSPMYPSSKNLDEIKKMEVKRNRLVLFLNSNNAWHGTNPFDGERRFIYFSIAAGDVESAFESKFSGRLGDRTRDEDVEYESSLDVGVTK